MKYIGIDLSTKIGYVELDGDTAVHSLELTTTITEDPLRMIDMTKQILSRLPENTIIAVEGFSYGSRGAGVDFQYGLGWMVRAELMKAGYNYIDVPPKTLKKFATGNGNAKKDALVLPIYKKWGFEHDSDNVRDAFVLAKIAQALTEKPELTAYQQDALKKIVG